MIALGIIVSREAAGGMACCGINGSEAKCDPASRSVPTESVRGTDAVCICSHT
jgi:hypothetical protein